MSGIQLLERQLNMPELHRQYIEIRQPYVKAICDVLAVSIPVKMTLNTETGELIKEYDEKTQSQINSLYKHLDDVTNGFISEHGLVQS